MDIQGFQRCVSGIVGNEASVIIMTPKYMTLNYSEWLGWPFNVKVLLLRSTFEYLYGTLLLYNLFLNIDHCMRPAEPYI